MTTSFAARTEPVGTDRTFLHVCVGLMAGGVVLVGVGCWLMPLRVARHWWRNR